MTPDPDTGKQSNDDAPVTATTSVTAPVTATAPVPIMAPGADKAAVHTRTSPVPQQAPANTKPCLLTPATSTQRTQPLPQTSSHPIPTVPSKEKSYTGILIGVTAFILVGLALFLYSMYSSI